MIKNDVISTQRDNSKNIKNNNFLENVEFSGIF